MPVFKTLVSERSGESLLGGSVKSDWEIWPSLDLALNELGRYDWELGTPLYSNASGIGGGPIGFILVNHQFSLEDDWERQIDKLRNEIAALQDELEGPGERAVCIVAEQVRTKQQIMDELLRKPEFEVNR